MKQSGCCIYTAQKAATRFSILCSTNNCDRQARAQPFSGKLSTNSSEVIYVGRVLKKMDPGACIKNQAIWQDAVSTIFGKSYSLCTSVAEMLVQNDV